MRWRLGASLLTVLSSAIAVATAVFGPMYLHTAGDSVLRRTISAAPVATSGLSVASRSGADAVGSVGRAGALVRQTGFYGPPITTVESGVGLASPGDHYTSLLLSRTGICQRLHFMRGGCDLGAGDVVMTARGARQLGVSLGAEVNASVTGRRTPLRLKLTGIVATPDLSLPYWWGDGKSEYFPYGLSGPPNGPPPTDSLIASPATVLAVPAQDVPSAIVQLPLRHGAVTLGTEADAKRALSRVTGRLAALRLTASTQLPSLWSNADHQRHAMTTIVAIAASQLVVLAVWVLGALLIRTSDGRRSEARVARLRGFPAVSMLGVTAAEPGLLCLLGGVLGVGAAWAAMALAKHKLFAASAAISFDGWAIAALGVATAAILGALGIGAVRLMRVADALEQGRRTGGAAAYGRAFDLVLVVLAIVALIALGTSGALGGHTDPLASIAPGLIALGTAVLGVGLVLALCRLALRATANSRFIGSFLALRQSVRRPGVLRQARVLIIALCLACFAAAAWSVARANRMTTARFQVGADTVLTVAPVGPLSLKRAVDRADPRGRFAMAVVDLRTPSTTLLAVDSPRLSAAAAWPDGISRASLRSVAGALRPAAVSPVDLAAGPLQIAAETATGGAPDVDLEVWVFSPGGGTAAIDMGRLRTGAASYRSELASTCPAGCELTGFGIVPAPGTRAPAAGSVTVTVDSVSSGPTGGALHALPALVHGGWRATAPGVSVGDQQAGRLTFSATSAMLAAYTILTGNTPPMASVADHPSVLPVVATPVVESINAGPGQPLPTQGFDGGTLSARPSITASALPRVGRDALLADLTTLANDQVGPATPGGSDEVWLGPQAPSDAVARLRTAGLAVLGVQRSSAVFTQLQRTGPALADDFLLLATIAALLVAIASTLGALGATTRARATELASLEVSGVPRRALVRSLRVETIILILTALCGAGAGALSAGMAVPSLPELSVGSFAPLHYGLPLGVIAVVTGIVAAAVAVAAAAVSAILLRRTSPALLRTVPDDLA